MKSKKLLAMLLALAMVFSLAACSSSSSSEDTASDDADTTTTESSDADTEADSADVVADVDALTINFSTTYYETETGGHLVQTFCDYIEEYSGGAMTVDVSWGGTVYSDSDILDGLSSGGTDMTAFGHMPWTGTLNYLSFPGFAPGSSQAALDYFDEIVFENEETSALIAEELAENNIIFFSVLAGGANAYCATYEFTDLDSLISGSATFGNADAAIFEYLGFNVTEVFPSDIYSSLESSYCDATQMGFEPMYTLGWYEKAAYWAFDGTYTAGNFISANLDWYNGLTEAQQEVIQLAATAVEEYSATYYDDTEQTYVAEIEEYTGNAFVEFSDEDIDRIWEASFEAKADAALETAEPNGKTEGMVTILELAAEITGYDWTYSE